MLIRPRLDRVLPLTLPLVTDKRLLTERTESLLTERTESLSLAGLLEPWGTCVSVCPHRFFLLSRTKESRASRRGASFAHLAARLFFSLNRKGENSLLPTHLKIKISGCMRLVPEALAGLTNAAAAVP